MSCNVLKHVVTSVSISFLYMQPLSFPPETVLLILPLTGRLTDLSGIVRVSSIFISKLFWENAHYTVHHTDLSSAVLHSTDI